MKLAHLALACAVTLPLASGSSLIGTSLPGSRPTGTTSAASIGALPLHTSGRWIVNAHGQRIKLAGVNWYGADQSQYVVEGLEYRPLSEIAKTIRGMGFNIVRLPYSDEMVGLDPSIKVKEKFVSANPQLRGKTPLQVYDATIDALAAAGMMVVLDNHVSDAMWCCNTNDHNGLWWNERYSQSRWIANWVMLAKRYGPGGSHPQPAVVGAELRNEPRAHVGVGKPVWDGSGSKLDWAGAATKAGDAVLAANPSLLIVVDGLNFALDLTGVRTHPIKLSVAHRLVYAAHDYYFAHPRSADYSSRAKLYGILDSRWGYLRSGPSAAPVWVSEFGAIAAYRANLESSTPSTPGYWFQAFLGYLKKYDYDWAFWPINGTQAWSVWLSRNQGDDEVHGILARNWKSARLPDDGKEPTVLTYLQNIQQSTPRTPVRLVADVRARPALLAGTFAPCLRSAFGRA